MSVKQYVQNQITLQESSISNLNWHLENNGQYIKEEEKKIVKQRISDFQDFKRNLEVINNALF